MKRLLVLFLAVVMLFSAVACTTGNEPDAGTTESKEQPTTKPQQTTDPNGSDDGSSEEESTTAGNGGGIVVPGDDEVDLDFTQYNYKDGENSTLFSMLTRSDRWNAPEEFIVDMEAPGTRTVLEMAVYTRNSDIEEALGIALDFPLETESNMVTTFSSDIGAGLHTYDICNLSAAHFGSMLNQGLLYDWQTVEEIGLDKVWWFSRSGYAQNMTVNGQLYGITGDLSLTAIGKVLLMYFNMGELEDRTDYTSEQLYELVWDGNGANGGWTMDLFLEITEGVYDDLNGNQEPDAADFYGATIYYGTIGQNFLGAFDIPIAQIDSEGRYFVNLDTDRMYSAINKLQEFYWEGDRNINRGGREGSVEQFASENVIFTAGGLEWINHFITHNVDFKYGVIPYPKLDDAQLRYKAILSNVYTMFVAPANITTEAASRTGVIMEYLASESYVTTTIAYYETFLKGRGTSDEDSYDMVDMIFHESLVFDPGFEYSSILSEGATLSLAGIVGTLFATKRGYEKFAELWEANKELYQSNFDGFFNTPVEE